MAFARQRPLRLYQQIARSLERLIADGEFGVGARLPAERDLAERLGVSRTSVREALIALEIAEIVEVRIGSGVYVTALPRDNGPDPIAELAEPGPYEVLEARRLIEGQTAYRAALAATDDQIRSMAECIAAMEAVAVKPRIRGELPGGSQLSSADRRGGWQQCPNRHGPAAVGRPQRRALAPLDRAQPRPEIQACLGGRASGHPRPYRRPSGRCRPAGHGAPHRLPVDPVSGRRRAVARLRSPVVC